jgi:hypothetical protein
MVLEPDGESILNNEKGRLKADGVQEGSESFSLFAPSSHVGDKFPLVEEGGGDTWNQPRSSGANSARPEQMRPRGSVLKPFLLSREMRTRLSSESKTSWAIRPPISAPFLNPMPSYTGERAEPTRSPTLERATRPTKRYQESPIPSRRGSPLFLGTKTDRVRSQNCERNSPESIRLQKVASSWLARSL